MENSESLKDGKRAERRHHVARIKAARRFYWGRDLSKEPVVLAKAVRTPHPCSCRVCGNDRKFEGRTIQERRFLQKN